MILSCQAVNLQPDFALIPDLGDPADWPELPPDAIVASTFLRLDPDGMARFEELNVPITEALSAPAPGLMGLSIGFSESCGTTRTLSVWATEADLMRFVSGPAHSAALADVGTVSRGGSITDSWRVSELEAVRWEAVAAAFAEHTGPAY